MVKRRKLIPSRDRAADRADLKEALRLDLHDTHGTTAVSSGEYKVLNTADILTDERYQRPINEAKIGRILKHYDENLVNPPKVSYRDGKYYVFDGQHTVAAVRIHNEGNDTDILCKVYRGLSFEQEVSLFIQQTGESSPVSVKEKLYARLSAGDNDVVEMDRAVKNAGLKISWKNNGQATGTIVAASALWSAYKRLGSVNFASMLEDMRDAWDGDPTSLRGEIITGMSRFYAAYTGDFKRDLLVKKLSKTAPELIIREGKLTGIGVSTGTSYAKAILAIYNKNLKHTLEDRF